MHWEKRIHNWIVLTGSLVRYNLKIIFGGKFIYFLGAAAFIFLAVTAINLYNADSALGESAIYPLLMIPGLLLVFYPSTFGIQNDLDSRMLEILFGIPNYRYKVWLFRLGMVFILTAAIVAVLGVLASLVLVRFSLSRMMFQVMFPVVFLGCLGFLVSTLVRSGSGTAVVISIISFIFWIGRPDSISNWKWNIFINPFNLPRDANPAAWADIVLTNRVIMAATAAAALLYALLNLQRREKFLG